MNELRIAGNRVLSCKADVDNILPYEFRVDGYHTYDTLMDKSISANTNLFKTPANLLAPSPGPGYQYVPDVETTQPQYEEYACGLINDYLNCNLVIKDLWYLYQTNDSWIDNPRHVHMTAEWIAVMYLDVKEGDSIQFFDAAGNMEEYCPEFGEVLFFPADAIHKPGPNHGAKRLTLNAELGRASLPQQEVETIASRMDTCKSCDRFNATTSTCAECSCYIPMKVIHMQQHCPLDKW